jgi:hypothetical protein
MTGFGARMQVMMGHWIGLVLVTATRWRVFVEEGRQSIIPKAA